jgi:hypothetical protein
LFAKVSGYIGGERMKKKTANVGKEPVPFNGTFDQFEEVVAGIIAQYHGKQQGKRSQLSGLSPFEAFNRAVSAGWEMTAVDPDAFATVFSIEKAVAIKNGAITVKGRRFYFDGLVTYLKGDYVSVRVPKYEHWARLPVSDMAGNFLGFAEEDQAYAYFDPAGARESDRRRALQRRAIRDLDKSATDIAATSKILDFAAHAPKALPAPIGARVTATDKEKTIARGLKETPKAQREREEAERRREIDLQRQLSEEFAAKHAARQAKTQ